MQQFRLGAKVFHDPLSKGRESYTALNRRKAERGLTISNSTLSVKALGFNRKMKDTIGPLLESKPTVDQLRQSLEDLGTTNFHSKTWKSEGVRDTVSKLFPDFVFTSGTRANIGSMRARR